MMLWAKLAIKPPSTTHFCSIFTGKMAHVSVPNGDVDLANNFLSKQLPGGVILQGHDTDTTDEETSSGDDTDSVPDEDDLSDIGAEEDMTPSDNSGNFGMADMMAKILRKKVTAGVAGPILADGPTDRELYQKKLKRELAAKNTIEVVLEDGTVVKRVVRGAGDEELDKKPKLSLAEKRIRDKIGRKKPTPLSQPKEANFARIATRGVAQLFNAVRNQQADVKEQIERAGGRVAKTDKIHSQIQTRDFLSSLSKQTPKTVRKDKATFGAGSESDTTDGGATDSDSVEIFGDSDTDLDDQLKEEKPDIKSEAEDDGLET